MNQLFSPCRLRSFAVCFLLLLGSPLVGQEVRSSETAAAAAVPVAKPGPQPSSKDEAKRGEGKSEKPAEKGGDPQEKDAEKPAEVVPPVTMRPKEPLTPPDPKELSVRPNPDGLVEFSFRNQPWPQLLDWLAEISGEPLDWTELPADFVNLASPRAYNVVETQDLFNRHLLARGFTLLRLDGGLSVVKTENLNPAMVPVVSVSDLNRLPNYQFVRTVMELDWLSAEKLATELKPLISAAGKLVPLAATNRIEAMDAVVNLRRIAEILADEQSVESRSQLAREFPLRYIAAATAKKLLDEFLGVGGQSKSPMDPRQMQQLMQMMQERMQGGGRPGEKQGAEKKDPEISIVANERANSLIVSAPSDRMAVASEFIKRIDVAVSDIGSLEDVKTRLDTFHLTSIAPAKVAEMLQQMNVLEPGTRLTVDDKNRSLVVFGSAADRYVVNELIKRLDGSGRQFSVLQLRRLDAREVAESITFLMGIDENKSDDSSSRRRYSYYWDDSNKQEDESKDHFRVAANVRNRQVLVWANEVELAEVKNLLVKLGELPPETGIGARVRTIEATNSLETYEYLQRLQRYWQSVSPTPLELPAKELFKETPAVEQKGPGANGKERSKEKELPQQTEDKDTLAGTVPATSLVSTNQAGALNSPEQPPAGDQSLPPSQFTPPIRSSDDFDRLFKPPSSSKTEAAEVNGKIRVEVDENGNLILMADDPRALDQLEAMLMQTPPPKKPYTVFYVRHATASWVVINLKDYFANEEDKKDSDSDNFYRWFWDMPEDKKKDPQGLAGGGKLKFVYDNDTGSIVVTGADVDQLRTIEELIKLWDVTESSQKSSRFTKLIEVQYSQAETIAETVKEAYRDLLSSNDKAFQQGGGQGRGGDNNQEKNQKGNSSGMIDSKSGQDSGETSFTFKGKLSIGVDKIGNTLLVSAEGESLLNLVSEMIQQLDEAAQPSGAVEVLELRGGKSLEAALRAALGSSMTEAKAPIGEPKAADQTPKPEVNSGRSRRGQESS